MFRKYLNRRTERNEINEQNYEAFDLLADRIKSYIVHLEYEFQKAIDKKIKLNNSAFSMYLSNLMHLKNTLDYELMKYGSDESAKKMEVYQSIVAFIDDCRMLVTNNDFEFDDAPFHLKINESKDISVEEIKRYIHKSLAKD